VREEGTMRLTRGKVHVYLSNPSRWKSTELLNNTLHLPSMEIKMFLLGTATGKPDRETMACVV
jgi:hypothetical protein